MRRFVLGLLASAFAAGTASAADLPTRMYTKAPPPPVVFSWAGPYLGVNIGGSWGHQDTALVTTAGTTLFTDSVHPNGVIGGGQIGYNWQFNQWVLGLEADFQGSGQSADGTFFIPAITGVAVIPANSISYTDKLDWFGTVRGRVGWAMDRWLPYVTGGFAYGHGAIDGTATSGATSTSFSGSKTYTGWTVGAGLEWAFWQQWSAKVEYLYIDFGDGPTVPVSAALNITTGHMTDNIVRAGVNYRF